MRRPAFVSVVLAFAFTAGLASAAEITRISSSFEKDDPLGLRFESAFRRTQHRSLLLREGVTNDTNELRFTEVENALDLAVHIGLWRDLQLTIAAPIVFRQDRRYGYPLGVNDENATAANNCFTPNGDFTDPNCVNGTTGVTRQALYDPRARVHRAGLGDFRFGLAYAIFNERKDDTKPTWIVGFDYTAPTAALRIPGTDNSPDRRGDIGERIHRYSFWTAFSRRRGPLDPYMKLAYTLPVRGPSAFSNCSDSARNGLGFPENCDTDRWPRNQVSTSASHVIQATVGTELIALESEAKSAKLAFDVRGLANYYSESRTYNELSDLLGRVMKTGEFIEVGGLVGINAQLSQYAQLRFSGSLVHRTDHFVSGETFGPTEGGNSADVRPSFDARVDTVSRRFRSVENQVFQAQGSLLFNF